MTNDEQIKKLDQKITYLEHLGLNTGSIIKKIFSSIFNMSWFISYLIFFGLLSFFQGIISGLDIKKREY